MISNVSLFAAFIAGIFMFLSPCIFPLLPVYFSVLAKDNRKYRNTILFLLGISTSFITLGFSFGYLSDYLYTPSVRKIAAIIIILLGFQQLELINFNFLNKTKMFSLKKEYKNSAVESYIFGLTFSLGWSPCVGPILASILALAAAGSTAIYGALLLFIFVLGFSIPFLIFTYFYDKLSSKLGFIKRNLIVIKKVSAILIILLGVLLFLDKLEILVIYFNKLSMR